MNKKFAEAMGHFRSSLFLHQTRAVDRDGVRSITVVDGTKANSGNGAAREPVLTILGAMAPIPGNLSVWPFAIRVLPIKTVETLPFVHRLPTLSSRQ